MPQTGSMGRVVSMQEKGGPCRSVQAHLIMTPRAAAGIARRLEVGNWRLVSGLLGTQPPTSAVNQRAAAHVSIQHRRRRKPVFDSAWQDLRYGIRLLRRSPLFTLTAALSLAIGIGANTTIFSAASAMLLRPLPGVVEPGRLVDIGRTQNGHDFDNSSYPNYRDIRARVTTLSDVYAIKLEAQPMGLGGQDGAERIYGTVVSANYFSVLGTRAHAGRLLMDADDEGAPGSHPVIVISYELWQRRFGGTPSIVGQTVPLNGYPFTIVGVTPPGFQGTTVMRSDAWVPITSTQLASPRHGTSMLTSRPSVWLLMGGRLKPGVSVAQANA